MIYVGHILAFYVKYSEHIHRTYIGFILNDEESELQNKDSIYIEFIFFLFRRLGKGITEKKIQVDSRTINTPPPLRFY